MKINVDYSIAKQIAQIICHEIKTSFTAPSNKRVYDKAHRCEKQYNQITKWMELGKVCDKPWPGAADYFVALSEWIVDAVFARLMSILFSQEPYMKARGNDVNSIAVQDNATDFVDMIFREKVKLYENTNFFFKQMIKLPIAVLKYDYVEDYDAMIKTEQAQTFINPADNKQEYLLPDDPDAMMKTAQFIANGYQQGTPQEVTTLEDIEIYSGAKAQYINIEDYAWAPDTKRNTKPYWEGDRDWFTLNNLMLKSRQEKFSPEAVQRIREINLVGFTGNDAIIKQREKPIECFHWYGRLPFNENNEIDLVNPDTIEQEVYCLVSLKEEELLQILSWPHSRYPKEERVYLRGMFEETKDFEGRSLLEKLYKTQQELNDFHNTLMNNAWIAMQKIFVKKKTLTGKQAERPKVFPGAMWEEEQTGDIRALEIGDVKSIGLELETLLLGFAEKVSNVSNWNLGVQARQGKATATEFMGVLQEGNIGREPFLQRCYKILTKLCEWTIDYYKDRLPPEMPRSIKTEKETIMPSMENMPIYQKKGINPNWQKEDFFGDYTWNWQGTTLNSDKQWNLMIDDKLEQMIQHQMINGNLLAVWTILKKKLVDMGVKNWEEILPPREAIIKEMQRMQMQAQARQQAPQAIGQMAVKKLIAKGMQPQQAMAAVKERLTQNAPQNSAMV